MSKRANALKLELLPRYNDAASSALCLFACFASSSWENSVPPIRWKFTYSGSSLYSSLRDSWSAQIDQIVDIQHVLPSLSGS